MKWLIISVLLICSSVSVAEIQSDERLLQADKMRLSDPTHARQLLAQIDVEGLTETEEERYRYLQVYLSTFEGDLQNTYEQYQALLREVSDPVIVIRATQSMLNISAYIGKWAEGFLIAERLRAKLEETSDFSVRSEGYKGLISFYKNAGQPHIAQQILDKLESAPAIDLETACFIESVQNELWFNSQPERLEESHFLDARELCRSAQVPYYTMFNITYLFYFYIQQDKLGPAFNLLQKLERKTQQQNYIFLSSFFYVHVAKLYQKAGNLDKAAENAEISLKIDENGQYIPSRIRAYEILAEAAKLRGDYRSAYEYLSMLESIRAQFHNQNVAKQLAFQQARFETEQKQNEIELLDKQNKLLLTESDLAKQEMKNVFLALALTSLALAGLLYWSYRSRKLQRKLRTMARTDSLTGLYNRGYFTDKSNQILANAKKSNTAVSLLLLDLDYFKQVNDTYGHQIGDWVLREVVRTLQATCPTFAVIGRLGGEEFGILLDKTDNRAALALAERCRKEIGNINTEASGYRFALSGSFGVSDTRQVGYKLDNLMSASDLALYQSKQCGRNQVYEYDSQLTPI